MITSRTPYRISFFGGGTDCPGWCLKHGGSVLATVHHANGGGFREEFNDDSAFAGSGATPFFMPEKNPVAKPFMQEFETRSICSALQLVTYGSDVLEWGSGNSTLYFSRFVSPESRWVAIEHDQEWARHVGELIEQDGARNISLHHLPPDGPFLEGLDDGTFEQFHNYVMMPRALRQEFGVIIVDGRARVACLRVGWAMLREDGVMVLHDAQRPEYREGLPEDAFFLEIRYRHFENNGHPIATLFMAKRAEVIAGLSEVIDRGDPDVTVEAFQSQPPALQRDAAPSPALPAPTPVSTAVPGSFHGWVSPAPAHEPLVPAPAATKPVFRADRPPRHGADQLRSILFLNTYYDDFLARLYSSNPTLAAEPYERQKAALLCCLFGDSDFYSHGMAEAGWIAEDCIVNCRDLQQAWATENGFGGSLLEVAVEQVRRTRPDVVYIQDLNICSDEFLDRVRPHARLLAGQIASPLPPVDLQSFDLIVSSFPHFVRRFRQAGVATYYQPLAFDPRVLMSTPRYRYHLRPVDCAFVGGLSPMHSKGYDLFEHLAGEVPIHFWGYGAERLPAGSAMALRHHGEIWGRDMFKVLASTRIALNRHIDVAEDNANNMRLFEATGCGALLVTDYKENLDELFEIGKEVVAYRTADECAALIEYYLANPGEAEAIARAGQERTLREHCYSRRMAKTAEILERHLRYREERGKYPLPERISDGHQAIPAAEVTSAMAAAWKDPAIPERQRGLVQQELEGMYRGEVPLPFKVLAEILKPVTPPGAAVLEIGCASGYYYEALEYLLDRPLDYTGVDYSEAMIAMAKDFYPGALFFAADGASLFFADRAFQIVISSCVLLHVSNYRDQIAETARVARGFVVAARTPVCRRRPTQHLRKFAYGIETVELLFNEAELLGEFAVNGFQLRTATEYCSDPGSDHYEVTYLLQRS